jgi:hypothetical protein
VLRQVASTAAVLWVTHDDQQPTRVGGKVLVLPSGGFLVTLKCCKSGSRGLLFSVTTSSRHTQAGRRGGCWCCQQVGSESLQDAVSLRVECGTCCRA